MGGSVFGAPSMLRQKAGRSINLSKKTDGSVQGFPLGTLKTAIRNPPKFMVPFSVPVKLRERPFFATIVYLPVFVNLLPFLTFAMLPSQLRREAITSYSNILCQGDNSPN